MGQTYSTIPPELQGWMAQQPLFFVATAPLAATGHVNCSPKGGDAFRVLDAQTVVYQDFTGSGAETIAHLRENGRLVIMFCAFEGPPQIVRLHGTGTVIFADQPDFAALVAQFPPHAGTRALIRLAVTRVSSSCGYGVPFMSFAGERDTLQTWATNKGPERLADYRRQKNALSIDGLPAVPG